MACMSIPQVLMYLTDEDKGNKAKRAFASMREFRLWYEQGGGKEELKKIRAKAGGV